MPKPNQFKGSDTSCAQSDESPPRTLAPPSSASSSVPPPLPVHDFSSLDFSSLCENENYRYAKNSKRVGHAVIKTKDDGQKVAFQYQIPQDLASTAPLVCQLSDIEQIERFGMIRYKAKDEGGKTWYAKRYDHAQWSRHGKVEEIDFAYFSEEEDNGKEPFWGSKKVIPRFNSDMNEALRKDFEIEHEELGTHTKGGKVMPVDGASVMYRDQNRVRKPDQNTLMGESARDAYEHFFSEMEDELSSEMKEILKRAFSANLRKSPENQYRPEWLHAYGFSLTPQSENPQTQENLGAAGKWANTEMMVLERIAKWFALNKSHDATITLKTLFEMLHGSELINKIHFEVSIEMKDRMIRFLQDLDTFKKYPIFRKASDLAQATAITHAFLHHEKPISKQAILNVAAQASGYKRSVLAPLPLMLDPSRSSLLAPQESSEHPLRTEVSGDSVMPKSKYPTYLKHENSIVQVLVTAHEPDYEEPWNGTHIQNCTGTGFVVEHEGEKYVITNAHCVSNQIRTQVRLANNREKKFDAKPIVVAYQADLALLKVKSSKFQAQAQPVKLGEMVGLHDEVFTVGFPMGGDEVSVTKGIVSRIEVQEYAMSGLDMLAVQIDAAINPGNSGGPVFCNDMVAGVAFQGMGHGQNVGYMIPIPILRHFLQEVFNGKEYRGFPILSVSLDALENKYQRRFYGMTKEQTGVLITKRSPSTDAHAKLKKDDILLELDGHKVSNQGTVDIPSIGNCISLNHLTHMKFIGDEVNLKVLRKNERGEAEIKSLSVTLDKIPLESYVVPQTEYDKMPTYYINSGFVFVPVSRNYLEGPGAHLEDLTIVDESHGTYTVGDMPKKHPSHQLVAINTVLNCKSTEGYDGFAHELVKSVNGKKIQNLAELIEAMESNADEMHMIETYEGNKIALKKLSASKLEKVMSTHKISFDRSEDLRAVAVLDESLMQDEVEEVESHDAHRHEALSESLGSEDSSSSADEEDDEELSCASSAASSSEEEEIVAKPRRSQRHKAIVEESEDEALKSLAGKFGMMPGQRRFMQSVQAMAHHYKHAPENDVVVDWDRLSDEEDEDFAPAAHSKMGKAEKKSAHTSLATNPSSLFGSSKPILSRKGHDELEEEQEMQQSKKRKLHHQKDKHSVELSVESKSVTPATML